MTLICCFGGGGGNFKNLALQWLDCIRVLNDTVTKKYCNYRFLSYASIYVLHSAIPHFVLKCKNIVLIWFVTEDSIKVR